MKIVLGLLASVAALAGFRYVAHRLATHQRILPNPLSRVNTQVHRINQ